MVASGCKARQAWAAIIGGGQRTKTSAMGAMEGAKYAMEFL
jgi:hypothetical protein